ncbi:TPA: hypothetical protein ACH3X1_012252 [Trebouxia sp. C0004]
MGGEEHLVHPPFDEVEEVLLQALAGAKMDLENTNTLLVLPDWPDAAWWPRLMSFIVWGTNWESPFYSSPKRSGTAQRHGAYLLGGDHGYHWQEVGAYPLEQLAPYSVPIVLAPAKYPEPETAPTVNPNLTGLQPSGLSTLLSRFPEIWASKGITGCTNVVRHRLPTRDAAPVKAKPCRMSQTDMQIVRENVIGMQASGVVVKQCVDF